jgi:hypothetical protein
MNFVSNNKKVSDLHVIISNAILLNGRNKDLLLMISYISEPSRCELKATAHLRSGIFFFVKRNKWRVID